MIDLTHSNYRASSNALNTGNSSGLLPAGGTSTAATSKNTNAIQLLQNIPEGQILSAKVKSSRVLNSSEKTLLLTTNPSLAQALIKAIAQSSGSQTGTPSNQASKVLLAQSNLYLATLQVMIPNKQAVSLTTITPDEVSLNQSVLVRKDQSQLNIIRNHSVQIQKQLTENLKQQLPKQQSISQLQNFVESL